MVVVSADCFGDEHLQAGEPCVTIRNECLVGVAREHAPDGFGVFEVHDKSNSSTSCAADRVGDAESFHRRAACDGKERPDTFEITAHGFVLALGGSSGYNKRGHGGVLSLWLVICTRHCRTLGATLHRMVQNASSTQKRVGRRPAFDRDQVIAAAIIAFWAKGFEATTLSDLESATGLDRSSIYNSFGGKEGLYRSAASMYVDSAEDVLFEPLYNGVDGVADIIEFLDRLTENLGAGTNPPGCLIVNDMSAAVDDESTSRYLTRLEEGLRSALERASESGEMQPSMNAQRRQLLVAAILGVNIAHRNDGLGTRAQELIDGLRSEVSSWAEPRP